MPTGYDARQGGRSSFANEGIAPVQTTVGASGESRGAQLVGGESIGGVQGGVDTNPGNYAAEMGAFMERFLEPVIARRKQAAFFEGYTRAQAGEALADLTDNDSPLTRIFGPSGFAEGAQFYHGQQAISDWQQTALADMDALKRMTPSELSKYMADTANGMMTGDPYADQVIQAGLLEAQGPVIQQVARERYALVQTEAREAFSTSGMSAATSLQQLAVASTASGGAEGNEQVRAAVVRFAGLMEQPPGMDDETYATTLYDFMRRNQAEGNFYAVRVMQEAGVTSVLTDEQQRQIEAGFDRYSSRYMSEAATTPAILEEITRLEYRIRTAEIDDDPITNPEVQAGYEKVNALIRAATGVDADYYTDADRRSGSGSLASATVSKVNRDRRRAEQIADRNQDRAERRAEREEEAADKLATLSTGWASGNVAAILAIDPSLGGEFNQLALRDYNAGNYAALARVYREGGFVSTAVAGQAQSSARAGIGEEYTQATARVFTMWQEFHEASPALSRAYFGEEYDRAFRIFANNRHLGENQAYLAAFSGQARRAVPQAFREEAATAIDDVFATGVFGFLSSGQRGDMTSTSQSALRTVIQNDLADLLETGDPRSPTVLVNELAEAAINQGRFEQYGEFGWANRTATTPLYRVLGTTQGHAQTAVLAELRPRLARLGVTDMDSVRIRRLPDNTLNIAATNARGGPVMDNIRLPALQARVEQGASQRRARLTDTGYMERYRAARRAAEAHIERRIPGESTWQRTTRINRETAAWSRANAPESYRRSNP